MQQTHEFLSAETLRIPQFDRDALIAVLAAYERGELKEKPTNIDPDDIEPENWPENKILFDMRDWQQSYECGSVCCIGGTAELLAGVPPYSLFENRTSVLYDLFYSEVDLSLPEAMQKLQTYLTTGKAPSIYGEDED